MVVSVALMPSGATTRSAITSSARAPAHGLEHETDELVAVVGVEEVLPRRAAELGLAQRPQRVTVLGAELGARRRPRGVAQQVVEGDRRVGLERTANHGT